jgi:uncharacterized phage protein (TIGR01671 family)
MREIKFRAWDGEQMRTSFVVHNTNGYAMLENADDRLEFRQEWKVMQYTGLKDKNGKEIYEGDVLQKEKYESTRRIIERIPVEWHEWGKWTIADLKTENFEVIGNIYQNPDLLK